MQRAARAEAQHRILREALAILAHDLSNPLQSLIVMTEMALDDSPPNSEEHERNKQSLDAAERMKTLVLGLAGLTRGGEGFPTTSAVIDRLGSVLSRRYERYRIHQSADLGPIADVPTPANLDAAILSLSLGVVAAAGERSHPRYDLSFRGVEQPGPRSCAIEITLAGHNAGGSGVPVELDRAHYRRTRQLVDGDPNIAVREDDEAILLEFAPQLVQP